MWGYTSYAMQPVASAQSVTITYSSGTYEKLNGNYLYKVNATYDGTMSVTFNLGQTNTGVRGEIILLKLA